ncbi:MAG: tol-pal system protein YbgF [Desulfovibrio sp.]|jgi:tol-pal system protein YbgF|nr:tol-pal system protein YbgF [Desulfovibrio sp.]
MKRILFLFAGIALIALNGCAALEGGGGNLSARVDRHDQQIQQILSQVGHVEQVLPGQAEMWAQMQNMRQELNMLNGKIDDLQRQGSGENAEELTRLRDRVTRLEAIVRQMASQLAINVDTLSDSGAYAPIPGSTHSASPPSEARTPAVSTSAGGPTNTAAALYDAGIKAFDQRRYKDAVVAFKNFSATFPKHNLASNAHFWEGESYFQMQDYARAALAYQEVIAKFPGSGKIQSAMLKQGIALYNAGKKPAAQERLQELIKRYPSSPEASRAKQFLASNK